MRVQAANTQANILRPLARPYCRYLFLRFGEQDAAARQALRELVAPHVISAAEQATLAESWKKTPDRAKPKHGRTVGMFGLSASGYHALGLDGAAPSDPHLGAVEFTAGPKLSEEYGHWDPRKSEWSAPYQRQIDAFLLLCDHSPSRLDATACRFRTAFVNHGGTIVQEERGERIPDPAGDPRASMEPFGFRDNVSKGLDPYWLFANHRRGGPRGVAVGCYATFLKLEQDVKRFQALADNATKLLDVSGDRVQEFAVGRQKNGAALPDVRLTRHGGMVFKNVQPSACPFHAHVRGMHRRDNTDPNRIIRRGFPYPAQPGASSPGLLFLSLQRRMEDFLTLIGRVHQNMDPLLSRSVDWDWKDPELIKGIGTILPNGDIGQLWPGPNGSQVCFAMNDVVKVLGAAYFFIPPMSLLQAEP
jgi:deferrochelatase/peroxidase EfeB